MRVVISGADIAGLSLALSTERHGIRPLIVEKSPALRASAMF